MKKRDLEQLGVPRGDCMDITLRAVITASQQGMTKGEIKELIRNLILTPKEFKDHPIFGSAAKSFLIEVLPHKKIAYVKIAPWKQWGSDIDNEAIVQMEQACSLPVTIRGALMPDAHVGYGLPIGGVIGVRNAVIPYAVGVDIACRMKISVIDIPVTTFETDPSRLIKALEAETRFGVGAEFKNRRNHQVMDKDWQFSPIVSKIKDTAWSQLGTSGSGNHFVEYGTLTVDNKSLGIEPGIYIAILSHSGSRGSGSKIATYFSEIARKKHPKLPDALKNLAWLELNSHEGLEYWAAMELMGDYAAANHSLIHQFITQHLNATILFQLENHHNFAWKEIHNGIEMVVHRKGATPAGLHTRGVIPGSMGTPGFIIEGKGNEESLCSASHGAGRAMSRKAAKNQFSWDSAQKFLHEKKVKLLSAGLDEVPMAYKNIHDVMDAQKDLVTVLARFDPRIVKMAPGNERPED